MASHFHIPGSFEPHTLSGVHPNVFRPPAAAASPSASTYLSAAPAEPTHPHAKRKRDETRENTPVRDAAAGRSYVLAGQIETPGAFDDAAMTGGGDGMMAESTHSDVAYRRRLAPGRRLEQAAAGAQGSGGGGAGEGWWSKAALGAIGDMVGKVWEFCRGGGFQGFYAGGGKGFQMDAGSSLSSSVAAGFSAQRTDGLGGGDAGRGFETAASGRRLGSTDPGAYFGAPAPGADFGAGLGRPLSLNMNTASGPAFGVADQEASRGSSPGHTTPSSRPAAKRRQVKNDELGRNWVIVDEAPAPAQHHHRRRSTRPSGSARPSTAFGRRARNFSPSVTTGRRINASTTPRPATAAGHYAAAVDNTTYNNYSNETPSSAPRAKRVSHAGSPALSPREPASFAAQRSLLSPPPLLRSSPAATASFPSPSRIPLSSGRVARRRTNSAVTSPISESGPGRGRGRMSAHGRTGSLSDLGLSGTPPQQQQQLPLLGAPVNGTPAGKGSPRLDPEARELAARRVKEERDADVRIAAFNSRLRDMIREGREALGTSVEVEGDGWMDD